MLLYVIYYKNYDSFNMEAHVWYVYLIWLMIAAK